MRVRYSDSAKADLRNLVDHISDENPSAASKLNKTIRKAAASLSQNARRGRLVDFAPHGQLRRIIVPPYLIFYEIGRSTVTIVRIVHGARDIPAVLASDPGHDGEET
jgi:toxin ParE1/3/4